MNSIYSSTRNKILYGNIFLMMIKKLNASISITRVKEVFDLVKLLLVHVQLIILIVKDVGKSEKCLSVNIHLICMYKIISSPITVLCVYGSLRVDNIFSTNFVILSTRLGPLLLVEQF